MSTQIVFDGTRVPVREAAATATIGHFATSRIGWSVGAGAILGGSVEGRTMSPGVTVSGSISWLPVYEKPRRPFFSFSASLGGAYATAIADDGASHAWSPWDLRVGAMVGKTLASHFVPYAAVRAFGGPVFWHRGGAS